MKVNLKRGINRLFVVFTFGWWVAGILYCWPHWRDSRGVPLSSAMHKALPSPPPGFKYEPFRTDDGKYVCFQAEVNSSFRCYPSLSPNVTPEEPPPSPIAESAFFALFPIAIYAVGLIATWIYRGFRVESQH